MSMNAVPMCLRNCGVGGGYLLATRNTAGMETIRAPDCCLTVNHPAGLECTVSNNERFTLGLIRLPVALYLASWLRRRSLAS